MGNIRLRICTLAVLLFAGLAAFAQQTQVNGTVVDKATGESIIGASVVEAGTQNGAITDFDGKFSLSVAPDASIVITYIGYKEVTVKAAPTLRIEMEEDNEMLEEVVVTGYSTQRKADLTGAISVVSVDEIAKQNENNPIKALQGRVPGMNITADGNPSGSATVRIRGVGTLNNNDPLYIIDGVPTKSGMHELNGNDIESIQVLKDAASASIYGSRAANGVIIITTKKGKEGQLKINFDASVSASMYTNKMEVLNAKEYGQAMWQAYVNDGQDPNTNPLGYRYDWGYDSNGYPQLNNISMSRFLDSDHLTPSADTDWFDETTRTGVIQQYNLSVSNGSEKGSSFFSLGYYKNLGIIKQTDFERFSARMNTEYHLIDKILTVGEHFTLNRTSEVQSPGGFLQNVLQFNPSLPVYTVEGEYAGPVGGYPDRENPVARLERNADNRYTYWRMFGDAYVNLNPFKGFNLRTTFGLDYAQKQQRIFTYPITEGNVANSTNAVEAKQEHWTKWMWNLVGTYNLEIGKHRGDVMAGMELNREDDNNFSGYREDFAILTPDYMWPDAGVGTAMAYGGAEGYSLVSFFGKLNYTYDEKYLFSLTVRHDGSSRFGRNNRYATFPSVSVGWRISNEKFMRDFTWLDDLKIRASWGINGNDMIDNTATYDKFLMSLNNASYNLVGDGTTLAPGAYKTASANNDLRWEQTEQWNVGIDATFLQGRLGLTFDWFKKMTTDMLISRPYIGVIGEGGGYWYNGISMNNNGVEATLTWRDQVRDFNYDVSLNVSYYKNEITDLPEDIYYTYGGGNGVDKTIVGQPFGSWMGYKTDGVFRTQQEVDDYKAKYDVRFGEPGVGRLRYVDVDGNGIIDTSDQTWLGSDRPKVIAGLNLGAQWKGFDLSLFFNGMVRDAFNNSKRYNNFFQLWTGNHSTRLLDAMNAWTDYERTGVYGSDIPALTTVDNNNEGLTNDYFIENGSYIKLKTLTLGYTFPAGMIKKARLSNLRLYFQAQNLFTITGYTGADPEGLGYTYPQPRTFTFGLNVGF